MRNFLKVVLAVAALAVPLAPVQAASPPPPQKLIIDTDFNLFGDDGQVFIMAAQAQAEHRIKILGLTLVTGNEWLEEQEVLATKAVERMGVEKIVPVYAGARYALLHSYRSFEQEKALFGRGDGYWGAWSKPEPMSDADLVLPPDGRASHTRIQDKSAAQFIIDTIRANPHEVTILAIGPLTNIALAIREAPDIVPLIGRIVYMGGAFDVPGNSMPGAEFNIWMDPEAARIVVREPIEQVFFPLDVTDTFSGDKALFDTLLSKGPPILRQLFETSYMAKELAANPARGVHFYDQLAFAYALDPTLATQIDERWVDVDTEFGIDYGRTIGYRAVMPDNKYLQKAKIVKKIDLERFEQTYIDLMTRPIPVVSH
jgi:purine nucleosidase